MARRIIQRGGIDIKATKHSKLLRFLRSILVGAVSGGAIHYGMTGSFFMSEPEGLWAVAAGTCVFLAAWFLPEILDGTESEDER